MFNEYCSIHNFKGGRVKVHLVGANGPPHPPPPPHTPLMSFAAALFYYQWLSWSGECGWPRSDYGR